MLTTLTSVDVGGSQREQLPVRANGGTRPRGSDGGVDGRIRGVTKERDGKEKESCCIRKLFIFLHGMVNTKEDARCFSAGRRSAAAAPPEAEPSKQKVAPLPTSSTSMQQITFKTYSVTSIYNGRVATATCTFEAQEEASSSGGKVFKYIKKETKEGNEGKETGAFST